MSSVTKKSDALKSALAASIQSAAQSASEVTVFGAGKAPDQEVGVGSHDSQLLVSTDALASVSSAPEPPVQSFHPVTEAAEAPKRQPKAEADASLPTQLSEAYSAAIRQPVPKVPAWEKRSITLENSDLDILDRFHASARDAGVKMRRGGNPSLFVRAALRAFDELSETNPRAWAEHLAAVLNREGA